MGGGGPLQKFLFILGKNSAPHLPSSYLNWGAPQGGGGAADLQNPKIEISKNI